METVGLQSILLLVLFAQILHCWAQTATCPGGYIQRPNGNCYTFKGDVVDKYTASQDCGVDGGYLASITSADEQQFIEGLLAPHSASVNGFWIGLMWRQPGAFDAYQFMWDSFDTFDYTNWAIDNPDMYPDTLGCVEMAKDGYKWNDSRCEETRHYICEIAVDMIGKIQACGIQHVPCDGTKQTYPYHFYPYKNQYGVLDRFWTDLIAYIYFNGNGHVIIDTCSENTRFLPEIAVFNSMDKYYYTNANIPDVSVCAASAQDSTAKASYDGSCPYGRSTRITLYSPKFPAGYYVIGIFGIGGGQMALSVAC